MVNCPPDFGHHPEVINGCSDLLVEVFGDAGRHARSAVGMGSLPRGMAVEIELVVEVGRLSASGRGPALGRATAERRQRAGQHRPPQHRRPARSSARGAATPQRRAGPGRGPGRRPDPEPGRGQARRPGRSASSTSSSRKWVTDPSTTGTELRPPSRQRWSPSQQASDRSAAWVAATQARSASAATTGATSRADTGHEPRRRGNSARSAAGGRPGHAHPGPGQPEELRRRAQDDHVVEGRCRAGRPGRHRGGRWRRPDRGRTRRRTRRRPAHPRGRRGPQPAARCGVEAATGGVVRVREEDHPTGGELLGDQVEGWWTPGGPTPAPGNACWYSV